MSGSGSFKRGVLGDRLRAIPVGRVHAVGVVLGDDLVAEELEQLEDLVAVHVLGEPEHELVTPDRRVGGELLGDLFGGAHHEEAALDHLVEQGLGVAAARELLHAERAGSAT